MGPVQAVQNGGGGVQLGVSESPLPSIPMTDVLVLGDGPVPADGILVGQNPGADEVLMFTEHGETPKPFVGAAGVEQDEYLRQADVPRSSLFITNAYKHFLIGNRRPTSQELDDHLEMLNDEIETVHPRVIGGVGDCASEWLSKLAGQPFRDMESEHGIPRWINLCGHKCILVPLYHPAAGLHNPESMGKIWYDYQVFGKVLRGEIQVPNSHMNPIGVGNLANINTLREIIKSGDVESCFIAIDTEGDKSMPWGLTFSQDGLLGYRVGVEQPDLLVEFNNLIHQLNLTIILQNSPHDIPVLRALGIEVCDLKIIDTMILAYLLCVEPQGLKALGWRWLRVAMKDYASIADPVTESITRKYLERASKIDWDQCPECGMGSGVRKKHAIAVSPEWLTPKGNIKKKFLAEVEWCKGGEKGYPIVPIGKRIQKMLE